MFRNVSRYIASVCALTSMMTVACSESADPEVVANSTEITFSPAELGLGDDWSELEPGLWSRIDGDGDEQFLGIGEAGKVHALASLEGLAEERAVAERVRTSGAAACLVAMGSPLQERWILEHGVATGARLLWAVGGALDFHAGAKRRAPRAVQRLGLEWAFRLALEPRRLARRYLIGNAAFALATLRERRALRATNEKGDASVAPTHR